MPSRLGNPAPIDLYGSCDYIGRMSRKPARRRNARIELTHLEELFVAEYMVDLNATAALVRAGSTTKYPAQQASEMLRKPHIAREIERRIAGRSEKASINAQWVLNELGFLYAAARAGVTPHPGGKVDRGAIREARATLEIIGKHVNVNAFRSQLGIGNPDGTAFDYSGLTDDQLDQLEALLAIVTVGGGSESREGETAH